MYRETFRDHSQKTDASAKLTEHNPRSATDFVRTIAEHGDAQGAMKSDKAQNTHVVFHHYLQSPALLKLIKDYFVFKTEQPRKHTKQEREALRDSVRSIVKDRREDISRSFSSMTEHQILLEALGKPYWSKRLQEKGVEVNEQTLDLIKQKLTAIDPHNLQDYNLALRNFNETLDQFQSTKRAMLAELPVELAKVLAEPAMRHVESAGLRAGACYWYDEARQEYRGRTMTLKSPEGHPYVYNKGEEDGKIAASTTHCIAYYKQHYAEQCIAYYNQHHDKWIEYYNQHHLRIEYHREYHQWIEYHRQGQSSEYYRPPLIQSTDHYPRPEDINYFKDIYPKGGDLTDIEVRALQEGTRINGWTCTKRLEFTLPHSVYYTDKNNKIYAVDRSRYEPFSREEHNLRYPSYITLGNPTPRFNCHSVFINYDAWLDDRSIGRDQIRIILNDNGYVPVDKLNAKIGDIVEYYAPNGEILHSAIVISNDYGTIMVKSKPGDFGFIVHPLEDAEIVNEYGTPTIYHTKREGGHSLRTTPLWVPLTNQSYGPDD